MKIELLRLLAVGAVFAAGFLSLPNVNAQTPAPTQPKMQWWRDARFGMFVHWGPITLKGTEISWSRNPGPLGENKDGIPASEYDELYKKFNPVKLNPKEIVGLAKAAGMKYIVFVCKHHDGFAEFDTQYSDYKITSKNSPFGKDIVKEMSDECHKAGLHWCVYYSQPDLHNPDYRVNQPKYDQYMRNQIGELLTNYGKVDLIWFDGLGASADFWEAQTLFDEMLKINPNLIINNRCGLPGNYETPEQVIGGYDDQHPWETCMTIGDQWSYKPNDAYKSGIQCIQTLAKCIGGDGNLLLNVGPLPDGSIDPTQADRLHTIAAWMKKHSEAVYGTRGGPFLPTRRYVSTRKGDTVYVHILKWEGNKALLPPLPLKIVKAKLLGGGKVDFDQADQGITVSVADRLQDPADTVIALQLDGDAMRLSPIHPYSTIKLTSSASGFYRNDSSYAPEKAFDQDDNTRWATDDGVKQAWIEADFADAQKISGVNIEEAYAGRVKQFELQYKAPGSDSWQTVASGNGIGENYVVTFSPIEASAFRLNILDSSDGPTISEFSFQIAK